MADRYFVERSITGDRATLTDSEAHHLLHVMRAKPGTQVVLFDGSGYEFPAQVEKLSRSTVELSVWGREEVDRELPVALTLGVALPKGDRQKWLVEKLVELGVTRLVPLVTERGVAQPVEKALARLQRSVIEASKQCGRNRLMQIAEPLPWKEFLEQGEATSTRLFAHLGETVALRDCERAGSLWCAVGPEGGFSDEEARQAREAGWQAVDLGQRVLRVETAAVALASYATLRLA